MKKKSANTYKDKHTNDNNNNNNYNNNNNNNNNIDNDNNNDNHDNDRPVVIWAQDLALVSAHGQPWSSRGASAGHAKLAGHAGDRRI